MQSDGFHDLMAELHLVRGRRAPGVSERDHFKALKYVQERYPALSQIIVLRLHIQEVEELGLIKFDFLGLSNLTILDNTLRYIKEARGCIYNLLKSQIVRLMSYLKGR